MPYFASHSKLPLMKKPTPTAKVTVRLPGKLVERIRLRARRERRTFQTIVEIALEAYFATEGED